MVSHVVGFNGKKLYDNPEADRETVADWVEKEKEKDPETFAIETKKAYNKGSDQKQYEKYKERLGKDMPKGGFQSFRDMKYNDPEKYEDLKAFYRYKGISPESNRRFFEANKAVDKLRDQKKDTGKR